MVAEAVAEVPLLLEVMVQGVLPVQNQEVLEAQVHLIILQEHQRLTQVAEVVQ